MNTPDSISLFSWINRRGFEQGVLLAALAGMTIAGYGWWHLEHRQPRTSSAVTMTAPSPHEATAGLPDFSAIIRECGPAVVNIQVVGAGNPRAALAEEADDPMLRFFRRFGLPKPSQAPPRQAEGSGFIVSPDGIILTNAHVVDGAREVTVKLTDRRELKARVVGIDKPTDVAVLRVEAHGLPVARLGAATPLKVGEWVLAIGSPFGFENSATAGIVSAKARVLPDETYVPFIQTDVAVNPGNSGGPLFNLRGEVVGINSHIYSQTGGYQGLSFAIPIELALQVKDQILQAGKVTRGRIGIAVQDMNQALAQSFSLKQATGALVSSVEAGSPAEKAGVKPGDVILELDGAAIQSAADLPPLIAALKPGDQANLALWRDGARQKLAVRTGEQVQEAMADADRSAQGGRLGLAVRPLSPEERRASGLNGGLLVLEVAGAAARAGIRDGDIVLALNGTPVRSIETLRSLAAKAGKHLALLVQRADAKLFVPLTLG